MDTKARGLCIATRCATVEEFVARFHPCCDEQSIFVSTSVAQQAGTQSRFAIVLADKTPVLRGWCAVLDAWSDADNPYGRPGMRLGVQRLTQSSMRVFETLLAARRAAAVRLADGSIPIAKPALDEWCAPTREVDNAQLLELVRQTRPPLVEPKPELVAAPASSVAIDRRVVAMVVAAVIAVIALALWIAL